MKYYINTLYTFLGFLIIFCGVRAGLSLFGVHEMTDAEGVVNLVILLASYVARIEIKRRRDKGAANVGE